MSATALSVAIYQPVYVVGADHLQTTEMLSYTHNISATGGYTTASLTIRANRDDAEDWIFSGLGRDIRVYSGGEKMIWRGFVNAIKVSLGALSVQRGPLLGVANRVSGKYQTPSYTIASVTVGGNQGEIAAVNDTDSQAKYGIRQKEISIGTATTTEADQITNTYLNENKEAIITHSLSSGSANNAIQVAIECMGYVEFLDYMPEDIAANGSVNLSAKITNILSLNPDSIFSDDLTLVSTNTTQVVAYWKADQTAKALIKSLVAAGGPSPGYARYVWGIYDDLRLRYNAAPTTHEYFYKISDPRQKIVGLDGEIVEPWDMEPAKFLQVSDFLVGRAAAASPRTDPRMMFIESVNYTAPYGLSLSGGRIDTIDQKLERLNLGGL